MLTVLIDYGAGNLHSAEKAFQRMAREGDAGEVLVSDRAEDVCPRGPHRSARRRRFPGVHAERFGTERPVRRADRSSRSPRPALSGHLRRHAIDGP